MSQGSPARSWSCCASSLSPAKRDRVSYGRRLFLTSLAGPGIHREGLQEPGGPVRTGMLRLEAAAGLPGHAKWESRSSASTSRQSKRASGGEQAGCHGCWHGTHGTGSSRARKPTGESAGGREQDASLALSAWPPLPTEPTSLPVFLSRRPSSMGTGSFHPHPRAEPPMLAMAISQEGAQGTGRAAQPRGLGSADTSPAFLGDFRHSRCWDMLPPEPPCRASSSSSSQGAPPATA